MHERFCSAGVASNPKLAAGTVCSSDGAKACDASASCKPLTFRVLRVGDGQTALSAASAAVFVEERRTDGTLVSTVALPIAASGAMQPFTMAGSATSEGGVALSASGHYLTAAGYATPPGTASVASTTAATVFRSAARIDAVGNVDTSTSFSTAESGFNARSAVSVDGAGIWIPGASGVWYGLFGAATQSGTTVVAAPSNVRWLAIFGGQLYGSSGSSGFTDVFTIGAGLPVTVNQTATPLPGLPTTGASPYGFVLFDLDASGGGERHALPGGRFGRSAEVDLRRQQLEPGRDVESDRRRSASAAWRGSRRRNRHADGQHRRVRHRSPGGVRRRRRVCAHRDAGGHLAGEHHVPRRRSVAALLNRVG